MKHSSSNPELESLKQLLKAKCYEATENKLNAMHFYSEALQGSPTCVEAFDNLVNAFYMKKTESKLS